LKNDAQNEDTNKRNLGRVFCSNKQPQNHQNNAQKAPGSLSPLPRLQSRCLGLLGRCNQRNHTFGSIMIDQFEMSFEAPKTASQKAFEDFDRANPRVWQLFVHFAHEVIEAQADHFGSMAIIQRIRWETSIATSGGDYKINNNFAPFYARKFHKEFPKHDGFFRTRESVADK
tara:strand:+ start:2304 stop:2819 length:516 start_codon:yes stop_codon:yes gene_type:complete